MNNSKMHTNQSAMRTNPSASVSPSLGTRMSACTRQKIASASPLQGKVLVTLPPSVSSMTRSATRKSARNTKNTLRDIESPAVQPPKKGKKGSKTLCAIHEDADTLLESLDQPKLPPLLWKSPPEDMGLVLNQVIEQSNHGVNSEVKGAASTLAYSLAYRGDCEGIAGAALTLVYSLAYRGSEEVTGAASTMRYSLAYSSGSTSARKQKDLGGSDDEHKEKGKEEGDDYQPDKHIDLWGLETKSNEKSDDQKNDDYQPGGMNSLDGLVNSADDDEDIILVGIDIDSENKLQSSFHKDTHHNKTLILGRPQPPDLSNYPESQHSAALKYYKSKRKLYANKERAKVAQSVAHPVAVYTGRNSDQLHPMTEVVSHQLVEKQTLMSKEIVQLCIAKEVNLQGIATKINRSDNTHCTDVEVNFYVRATFSAVVGWIVHTAVCRDRDNILQIPPKDCVDPINQQTKCTPRTPLKSRMIVPIILTRCCIGQSWYQLSVIEGTLETIRQQLFTH